MLVIYQNIIFCTTPVILFLLSLQCLLHEASAFAPQLPINISCRPSLQKRTHNSNYLFATSNEKSTTTSSKSARERGIYSRPSAAIERGSGFFIPGLEGPRIRILFGMTVLIADAANHVLTESQVGDYGQVIAEVLSAGYGAFLLLQGLIESGVGNRGVASKRDSNIDLIVESDGSGDDSIVIKSVATNNGFSPSIEGNKSAMKSMQRLAQTIVSLTPATHFLVANEEDGILYRYGGVWDGSHSSSENEDRKIIKLTLDAIGSSRAGRVALPSDHPASKLLPTSATRCILVQSIDGYGSGGKSCLIIGSDKLLPAYTKNDLRWIGQLAVEPKV
jgi:hypothetical protein